jgi:hypothetical protein
MSIQKFLVEVAKVSIMSAALSAPTVGMMYFAFKKLNEMPVKVDRD